jgi:hypothetical protein
LPYDTESKAFAAKKAWEPHSTVFGRVMECSIGQRGLVHPVWFVKIVSLDIQTTENTFKALFSRVNQSSQSDTLSDSDGGWVCLEPFKD